MSLREIETIFIASALYCSTQMVEYLNSRYESTYSYTKRDFPERRKPEKLSEKDLASILTPKSRGIKPARTARNREDEMPWTHKRHRKKGKLVIRYG